MLLDFDPQVTVIAAQPLWLRWRDDADGSPPANSGDPGLAHRPPSRRGDRGRAAVPHHAIHLFEGYAGTSDSGFHAEVVSEWLGRLHSAHPGGLRWPQSNRTPWMSA